MQVVIIGAGIIGASTAWHLAQRGVRATVIDAGPVAGQASGRGFGWLNASFHLDEDHFHLRVAALDAWRRLPDAIAGSALRWTGCLCWEEQGAALDQRHDHLKALGYPVDIIDSEAFARLEPSVAAAPERCLRFPGEGAADLGRAAAALLAESQARVITGVAVRGIETRAGRITGVALEAGRIPADRVIVAAGTGAPALLAPLGVALPMIERPGLMLRSRPLPPVISHVLVSPDQELRQDRDGRILAPTVAKHQCDDTDTIVQRPDALADQAMARLRRLLPGLALEWEEVRMAARPVPGDGRPVIGPAGPDGLYLAVMHSGATLGALAGALAAGEIAGDAAAPDLAPYRPGRFAA